MPEAWGGSGGTIVDLAILAEELGRVAYPSPLLNSVALGALPLVWAGSDEQRARWLPALVKGEAIATMALVEPGGGDEWSEVRVAGRKRLGANWQLNRIQDPRALRRQRASVHRRRGARGSRPVLDRAGADHAGHQMRASSRDRRRSAVHRQFRKGGDQRRRGCSIPTATRARCSTGLWIMRRSCTPPTRWGYRERALALAIAHVSTREQFGRPIGSFQAVAHRCSDMRIDIDACRFLALQAAWRLDQGGPADLDVAAAKAYINDAVRRVFVNAHQVHGAIGFSAEYDLQLFTRRAKAFELSLGGTAFHHERVAKGIGL